MGRPFKTLYAKIASSLLLLLALLTGLEIGLMYYFWNRATAATEQRLHWGLAGQIAARMGPSLLGSADYWGLQQVAKGFTDLNPYIDVYLLDGEGVVVADFAEEGALRRGTVDLGPVARFQQADAKKDIPLLGDDPHRPGHRAPFSVAKIDLVGRPGFVYVVLSNPRHQRLTALFREDSAFRGLLLASTVPLIGVALLGLVVFSALTRRFHRIIAAVVRYERGELDARLEVRPPGEDELDALALAINRMMGAIEGSIAALREKDRLRRELIANLWHDLRGPVGTIGNLAELLMRGRPDETGERLLVLRSSAQRLGRLLGELLELARLETREIVPNVEPFSLEDLVQDIALNFTHAARERGIELRIFQGDELPPASGDPLMIGRVLSNLLENAFRYTPPGGRVEVRLQPEGDRIVLEVADTGVGIPEEDLPHVFERHYQASAPEGFEGGAQGLGLAIVRKIVEAHHSDVRVHSAEGRGTCFSFSLAKAA